MAIEIPFLPDANAFEQRMRLDGEDYTLTFRWNPRAERWFMDLGDPDGSPIVNGLALVIGSITRHLRARVGMPPGLFICLDTSDSGVDPGFDELGSRVKLVYLEEADLEGVEV